MAEVNMYNPDTQVEDAAHVAAMLEKGEQIAKDNLAGQEERPEWLPEKFNSTADLAAAYAQLEQRLSRTEKVKAAEAEEEAEATAPVVPEDEIVATTSSDVEALVNSKGLSYDALDAEFQKLGGLSEESYETLANAGFPRQVVETWLGGQTAMATEMQNNVFNLAGGKEAYAQTIEWASNNLPETEIDAFNSVIATGDLNMIGLALRGVTASYKANAEPSLLSGNASNNNVARYLSSNELTTAMKDPRYAKDSAYREEVTRKLAASAIF